VLLVVAGAALILGVIAFGLLRGDTFGSIDSSIKFLQASALAASGFRSTALPYPALALDPGQMFVPFDPPYVFRGATGYESVFSSGYAILAAPVIHLGPGVLRALSIFGGAATAAGTAWLAERGPRWVPAVLITFATPMWYYATASGETTLALHAASDEHSPGSVQLGFAADNLAEFYDRRDELGLSFTQPPTEMHGVHIARLRDIDGAETSVSGPV